MLCPRRGGAFKPTNDSRWAHTFCGRNAPGQTRVSAGGVVEIRLIPKECKKVKCGVCNRQHGACVRCAYLGCTTYFHPLCAERGGKGYLRTRLGEREAFCHQHIPEGLDRCEGYLVDGPEIHRLRISLDRSRVILDTLLRREKFKLRLCKLEGEHFSSTFFRTLDRAKGRKHENSLEYVGAGDSESEYGEDDYGDEEGSDDEEDGAVDEGPPVVPVVSEAVPEAAVVAVVKKGSKPKSKDKAPVVPVDEYEHCAIDFKRNRGEDVSVTVKGRELQISGAWTKGKEINMPRRLGVVVVGLPIQRRDASIEGGRKIFLRVLKEKVDANRAASRSQTDIFISQKDAIEFGKKLGPSLLKHMSMSEAEFSEAMGRMHIMAYPDFDKMVQKQTAKALKATQKLTKQKGSASSTGAPPKPLGLYDLPLEIEAKRRKTAQSVVYFEEPETDDLDVPGSILGHDDGVDEDFLTSDFFMTDKEAENEFEFSLLDGLDTPLGGGVLGLQKETVPIRPKDKRVRIRAPRDRSRDRPRKRTNDGKNGSAVSTSEPNSASAAGAGSSSSSKGTSRVAPPAPVLCPLDLSMIVIPVKGRKRDIERALKREMLAKAAAARAGVIRAGY